MQQKLRQKQALSPTFQKVPDSKVSTDVSNFKFKDSKSKQRKMEKLRKLQLKVYRVRFNDGL